MNTFFLLTTSIVCTDTAPLKRMIDSIREHQASDELDIRHILLLQNTTEEEAEFLRVKLNMPAWTTILTAPGIMSLSKARNIMLRHLWGTTSVTGVVGFPDDDCWYQPGLLNRISQEMQNADLFFCKYATQITTVNSAPESYSPGYTDVVFNASSNTLFVDASLARRIGMFDEELGVGARYNGGEDLDYAVKAYRLAKSKKWISAPLVGHRDKVEGLKANYFTGSARVLRRNALYSPAAFYHFLRKMLIGIYMIVKGDMPLVYLLEVFVRSKHNA